MIFMKNISFLLFFEIAFLFFSCNSNGTLLEEYKLLYTDLENINTNGYKSYYSDELNMATSQINVTRGTFVVNEIGSYLAIDGNGFFKIRLGDEIGYTKNGQFDICGNYELLLMNKYPLFDPIFIPINYLYNTIYVNANGDVYCEVFNEKDKEEYYVGKIETYEIPNELLVYYKEGIYKLKDTLVNEAVATESKIYNGVLESRNYNIFAVLLRMNYILSKLNGNTISNIEFKKELIKILIENILSNGNNIDYEWTIRTAVPFIKYDY